MFPVHTYELFPRTTGDTFDPLSPATVAADVTVGFLLQLDRAARMVAQHAVDPAMPGLEDVIDRLTSATFDVPTTTGYEAAVRRAKIERVEATRRLQAAAKAAGAPAQRQASADEKYAAEKARCGLLGEERDNCMADLKKRFHRG